MSIMKSRSQIAAEEAIQYLIDYESERIMNGRRLFYVGSHEKPEASVRQIANVSGIIAKYFPNAEEKILDDNPYYRKHLNEN